MSENLLFDLVKETRQDVKALNDKLHAHILITTQQLEQAQRPTTFLTTLGNIVVKIGALAGLLVALKTFAGK